MRTQTRRLLLSLSVLAWTTVLPSAAQDTAITVPFSLEDSHKVILVKATINERPASLILDTGAAATILTPRILAMKPADLRQTRFTSDTAGITGNGAWVSANLKLGDAEWKNQRVFVMELDAVSQTLGRRVDGILGQDLLTRFQRVVIDFKTSTLALER